jgi:DNA-binding transcriptional ArsR family regulator
MREKDLEKTLKALANKRRLTIVKYLKKRNNATVGNIANHLKLSFKSTSKHLNILFLAEILEREQKDLQKFYSLSKPFPSIFKPLLDIL